jgi:hypothetical protein
MVTSLYGKGGRERARAFPQILQPCASSFGQRSFWVLAAFSLSHRALRPCSFAQALPKAKNPRSSRLQYLWKGSRKASRDRAAPEPEPSRNRAVAHLCSPLLGIARLCSPFAGELFFAGTERRPSELRQLRLKSKSTTWVIVTQAVKTMQHAEFHVAAARASLIAAVRGVGQQPPKLPRGTETPAAGRREDVKLF